MKILTYFTIFISKIIENALSTLRLIVVAKGKKIFGAILQFIIAFVWVITTGIVVVNIKEDPYKIIFFALGSLIGSYIGSIVEEKIALGNDLITVISNKYENEIIKELANNDLSVFKINGYINNKKIPILFITNEKRKRKNIIKIIKKIDNNSIIQVQSIKNISN